MHRQNEIGYFFFAAVAAFAVTHLHGKRDLTEARADAEDLPASASVFHEAIEPMADQMVSLYFKVPGDIAWRANRNGWVVGEHEDWFFKWRPGSEFQLLSHIEDPQGAYNIDINDVGDVVTSQYLPSIDAYVTELWPASGGRVPVALPGCADFAVVTTLDDLGTLWFWANRRCSIEGLFGYDVETGVRIETPFRREPPEYRIIHGAYSKVSKSGTYWGQYTSGWPQLTYYLLGDEIVGTRPWQGALSGIQILDVNAWGAYLATDGLHLPSGQTAPMPADGYPRSIDEKARLHGTRIVESRHRRCVWTARWDEDGIFAGYEREDYLIPEFPSGYEEPGDLIAPGEFMPQVVPAYQDGGDRVYFLIMPVPFDLDTDSDNDGVLRRSPEEDESEAPDLSDPESSGVGKLLQVNSRDADFDGVPDFADGMDLFLDDGARFGPDDGIAESWRFAEVALEVGDFETLLVSFDYDASPPSQIARSPLADGGYAYEPAPGQLRLWLKDGSEMRGASPVETGGDFIRPKVFYTRDQLGLQPGETAVTLYVESVRPSREVAADRIAATLARSVDGVPQSVEDASATDEIAFSSRLPLVMIPDYDRDGVIDDVDLLDAQTGQPLYFWLNDDDDESAVEGNDIPETRSPLPNSSPYADKPGTLASASPDYADAQIDGMRDLEDFFPLRVSVGNLLDSLDISKVELTLSGLDVNFVDFSSLQPDHWLAASQSGAYLRNVTLADKYKALPTIAVRHAPVPLPPAFASHLRANGGELVLLLEGAGESAGVGALELRIDFAGEPLEIHSAAIQFSPVESMFQHINLIADARAEGPKGTPSRGSAYGWPTADPAKTFVYLHGYNINNEQARGEHATVFKRLYQTGLNAEFVGVTWFGWQSQKKLFGEYKCPNYYDNIINSFKSSRALAQALQGYERIAIGAHSMGNVVVSSAIADWELKPEQYFLFNAAVAAEAYDTSAVSSETMAHMSPRAWADDASEIGNADLTDSYEPFLWASEWHTHFSESDVRQEFGWRDRFGPLPTAYNFFSSSENVLMNGDGKGVSLLRDFLSLWRGDHAWYAQEVAKGTRLGDAGELFGGGTSHAGWGLRGDRAYRDYYAPGSVPRPREGWQTWGPEKANVIDPALLLEQPFFEEFEKEDATFAQPYDTTSGPGGASSVFRGDDLYGLDGEAAVNSLNPDALDMVRAKMLAEAIPAVSYAVGANVVESFVDPEGAPRNFDMPTEFRKTSGNVAVWPEERDGEWLHGDLHRVALPYLFLLYEGILELGELER